METGLRLPGFQLDQAGQPVEDGNAHPLTVKERTAAVKGPKRSNRRGEASVYSLVFLVCTLFILCPEHVQYVIFRQPSDPATLHGNVPAVSERLCH
jgi:hypothetical protein